MRRTPANTGLKIVGWVWPCRHLGVSPVRLVSDVSPTELEVNKCVLFEATKFVVICPNSRQKTSPGPPAGSFPPKVQFPQAASRGQKPLINKSRDQR